MLARLIQRIPRDWLVYMYRHMPLKSLKNTIVYRTQHKFLVAVLGVITNDAGEVLLLKHTYRDKEPWGIPGGWMELEKPEQALEREIWEETQFKVKITRLERAIYSTKPGRVELVYRGIVTGGTFQANSEISETMFCDKLHLPADLPSHQKRLIAAILDGEK
ncbi:RNA pyrophosphohydrolase [compost metagenome]